MGVKRKIQNKLNISTAEVQNHTKIKLPTVSVMLKQIASRWLLTNTGKFEKASPNKGFN